jgi:hypothetical protein
LARGRIVGIANDAAWHAGAGLRFAIDPARVASTAAANFAVQGVARLLVKIGVGVKALLALAIKGDALLRSEKQATQ